MKKLKIFTIMMLAVLPFLAGAGEVKLAVINMEKVFQGFYLTKITDANLKKKAESYKAFAEQLNNSRSKLLEEFKELRDASQNIVLSDVERESKRLAAQDKFRQIKEKENEIKQYQQKKQIELREEYEQMRNKLLEKIKQEVKRQCILKGYNIVIDSSGRTLNNIPALIYVSPTLDITDTVLKELNRANKIKNKLTSENNNSPK